MFWEEECEVKDVKSLGVVPEWICIDFTSLQMTDHLCLERLFYALRSLVFPALAKSYLFSFLIEAPAEVCLLFLLHLYCVIFPG